MSNLAGYRVMYGQSPNDLYESIEIKNASISTYVVEGLAAGTWYFAVAALNTQGSSSVPSDVVSKTVS